MYMLETIKDLLAKQLRVDREKITLTSRIKDDLGADSLDILQLLMTVEDDYGIAIPDKALATFNTVGDVVAYLDAQKAH